MGVNQFSGYTHPISPKYLNLVVGHDYPIEPIKQCDEKDKDQPSRFKIRAQGGDKQAEAHLKNFVDHH